jgi:hypothetical protein
VCVEGEEGRERAREREREKNVNIIKVNTWGIWVEATLYSL